MEPIVGETLGPCVLLDTNIWREESILRTPLGVAVLYSIRQRGGTLGLPEIIEREARKQCLEAVLEATERIEKSRRLINRFLNNPPSTFSSSQPPRSPNTRRINEAFDNRLKELDPILARIPFSNEQALRALDRVDERRPPAARKAEFKDCAIWEAALDLAEQYAVYLVTRDGSFYDGDDLARGLRQECQERYQGTSLSISPRPPSSSGSGSSRRGCLGDRKSDNAAR
jgi:hypothetical protein